MSTTSIDPRTLVEVAEVWLLDREDGAFDWGVVVASTGAVVRGDVTVTARLYDPTGAIVEIVGDEIGLLPAGARAAAGGVVRDLPRAPSRIEVDVTVGRPIDGSVGGSLAARAVERRVDARAGSDVLIGRIVSRLDSDVESVRLAAIWRDEDGAVVAAVFDDIERVRPGVDARFEIPLDGLVVPDGPPDEVLLSRPAP